MSWSPLCPDRFQCSQCFHEWSSAKVHILFHMCHCQGWGTVLMRIFRQKCRHCPNPRLEDPDFSLETLEMILHNLVIKILQYFYNKPVQPSDLLEIVVDTPVTGPHDSAHCEACQLGICNRSWRALAPDAWKPLMDEDKATMHSTESWLGWAAGVWKSLANVREARTHRTEPQSSLESSLGSDDCEPLTGVGKARTHRAELQSSLESSLGSDDWKSLTGVGKARTPHTELQSALESFLGSDDCEPLTGVGKARTHCTGLQPAPARVAGNASVSRTSQTLKHQGLRPHAAATHHPSPSNSSFPWKRCFCIGSSLLCVLALIIFVVLYLTVM
ncbi:uncharacterized protein LOC125331052 [Corvus hawaiiensis]|uniref:uncharacterized protein LOC125331052 n=1 Tax=Corvus hawaiiensis TaxID=134902 RepID=UPI002018F9A6|nr:uncharacterized protein LOC125331052 [Corvus hawaiiensis]